MTYLRIRRGLKVKRCKCCPRLFMPARSTQLVCSPKCLLELRRQERIREKARLAKVRARWAA